MVGTDEISVAMGEEMHFWEPLWVDGSQNGLGGVRCGWLSGEYLSGFTTIWVYPLSMLDPEYVAGEAANSCSAEDPTCMISGSFGDAWVGVQAYSDRASEQIEDLRPVLAGIGERVAAESAPVPGPLAGWWMPVPTCDDVASALSENGIPATATDDRPASAPVSVSGPLDRGCSIDIEIQGERRIATLTLTAGAGAGVESALGIDGATSIDYNGRTFVGAPEQYPIDGNPGLLLGTDGTNLVSLLRGDSEVTPALDAPILDALLTAVGG